MSLARPRACHNPVSGWLLSKSTTPDLRGLESSTTL